MKKVRTVNFAIFILIMLLFSFIFNEVSTFYFALEQEKKNHYEKNKNIFDNLSHSHQENVNMLATTLSHDSTVKQAYIDNDFEMLKNHVMPVWNQLKYNKFIYEIHFFKPPATSFVNFSNFDSLGHDVSGVRKDIQWVTSSFQPSTHIMMCKTYAGLRATHPILSSDGKKVLGGLSMGKKIDWIPEELKKRSGDESFLVYTKLSTKTLEKKYYENFMKGKSQFDDLILAEKTLPLTVSDMKKIDFTLPINEVRINGKNYVVNSYPIIDFNQNLMGYVGTLFDLNDFYDRFIQRVSRNLLVFILTGLLIYLIVSKKLKRILVQSKFISRLTQQIKARDFSALHDGTHESELFEEGEVLSAVKNNVVEMGKTIEKKYTQFEIKLLDQFFIDSLTKMPNRNAIMRDLVESDKVALTLLNIRSFKQINDVFGFEGGSQVLVKFSKYLDELCQKHSFDSYHLGSDEFAIVVKHWDDELLETLKEIVQNINTYVIDFDDGLNTSISVYAGICLPTDKQLVKADMALTQAKKSGKRYVIYSEETNTKEQQVKNMQTVKMLQEALRDKQVIALFQPIVDTKSQQINKYEALMRIKWKGELLSPYTFLDLAKKTMYYYELSKEVISYTLEVFKHKDTMVSINLSALDILDDDMQRFIFKSLDEFNECERIVFELTETEDLYATSDIEKFVKRVKTYGCKIAIDDFGTGYSNFSYLTKLEPNYIKIDASLIKNIDSDEKSRRLVVSIIEFSQELNMTTIAEFVHNEKVMQTCIEIGIDELQGFYLGEPQELDTQ